TDYALEVACILRCELQAAGQPEQPAATVTLFTQAQRALEGHGRGLAARLSKGRLRLCLFLAQIYGGLICKAALRFRVIERRAELLHGTGPVDAVADR